MCVCVCNNTVVHLAVNCVNLSNGEGERRRRKHTLLVLTLWFRCDEPISEQKEPHTIYKQLVTDNGKKPQSICTLSAAIFL